MLLIEKTSDALLAGRDGVSFSKQGVDKRLQCPGCKSLQAMALEHDCVSVAVVCSDGTHTTCTLHGTHTKP